VTSLPSTQGNNGEMARDSSVTRFGEIVRENAWHGVRFGDLVVVNSPKRTPSTMDLRRARGERATGDEWVEVRGGRVGESKGRSFLPELIYPSGARKGSRVMGLSLATAPQLALE